MLKFLRQERKQTEKLIQLKEQTEEQRKSKYANVTIETRKTLNTPKFNNSCLIHTNAPHLTRKCSSFLEKSAKERGEIVKNLDACKLCLSLSHIGNVCPFVSKWGTCNVNG